MSAAAKGERALLHVYEPAKASGPSIPGFGVYHTGIELGDSGVEWCYAGGPDAPGSGVQQQRARQTPDAAVWRYRETIDLGASGRSASQCGALMRDLQAEYAARDYDVVHRNCNHFTADVAKRLGLKYPSHINRAAALGSFFLDNPIRDRQRKEAERKAEEERRRNVFANTTGHSLLAGKDSAAGRGSAAGGGSTSAAASPLSGASGGSGSASSGRGSGGSSTATQASGAGGRRNPWADPAFFPGSGSGKGKPAAASRPAPAASTGSGTGGASK